MVWQQWVLIGLYVLSILVTIGNIGKPRKPNRPSDAVMITLISAGMVALVVTI